MDRPLAERLKALEKSISFHTPGHNGGVVDFLPFSAAGFMRFDLTETYGTDNLLEPETVILDSERATGACYGTGPVMYSTAGATALMQSAVWANRDKRILIAGAAHKSVYNAVRISGAEAYQSVGLDIASAIALSRAEAVIVTSPDYFGRCADLAAVSEAARTSGAVLIVDASHGAHFAFSTILPDSATEYADIVIHSMHKTMPVFTGGAIMHSPEKERGKYMEAFALFHTTSPSYPVMLSIEGAAAKFKSDGEAMYALVAERLELFKEKIKNTPYSVAATSDPTRLVIEAPAFGGELYRALVNAGIYAELYTPDEVVFIVTPYNDDKLEDLSAAIRAVPYGGSGKKEEGISRAPEIFRLAFPSESERVPVSNALGRVVATPVGMYPPGTPTLFPGEEIGAEELEILKKLSRLPAERVFGLENGSVNVVK